MPRRGLLGLQPGVEHAQARLAAFGEAGDPEVLQDRFARGATIASHGSDETDEPLAALPGKPGNGFPGLGGLFGASFCFSNVFNQVWLQNVNK